MLAAYATAVYINHFNIQEGDGWFGNSEMLFVAKRIVEPISAWVGQFQQFPVFAASCELGTYQRNDVVEDLGYYGLWLVAPASGVTTCNGSPGVFAIQMVELDGFGTGDDDEYGWRFYTSGAYPKGAIAGTSGAAVMSFYINTNSTLRSAYLRVQS